MDGALGNAAYKITGYKAIQVIRPAMYNLVILPLALPRGTFLARSFKFLFSVYNVKHRRVANQDQI